MIKVVVATEFEVEKNRKVGVMMMRKHIDGVKMSLLLIVRWMLIRCR